MENSEVNSRSRQTLEFGLEKFTKKHKRLKILDQSKILVTVNSHSFNQSNN